MLHRLPPAPAPRRGHDAAGRSAGSRPRTSTATSRPRGQAGVEELGVSEHVYRFRQALDVWRHPFWVEQATDDLDAYCEFVRTTPLSSGSRPTGCPAPRSGSPSCWRRATSTTSSARCTSSATPPSTIPTTTPGRRARPGGRLALLLRGAGRRGALGALRHPRPPDLVKVWGRGRPAPEGDPRVLLRAGGGGDRRVRDRGRGLDRGAAQAGRRDLSRPRRSPSSAPRRGRRSRSPPTPTSPSTSATPTSRRWRCSAASR